MVLINEDERAWFNIYVGVILGGEWDWLNGMLNDTHLVKLKIDTDSADILLSQGNLVIKKDS